MIYKNIKSRRGAFFIFTRLKLVQYHSLTTRKFKGDIRRVMGIINIQKYALAATRNSAGQKGFLGIMTLLSPHMEGRPLREKFWNFFPIYP